MKVHLATAADEPWSRSLRAEVEAVAARDRFGEHEVVDDPAEADIILFLDAHQLHADWRMRQLRDHRYVRDYPDRVFVYDERDLPRDLLPGVYVCMPRARFDCRRHAATSYFRVKNDTRSGRTSQPDLLFSFQGRNARGVRSEVLALAGSRAFIQDTSQYDFFGGDGPSGGEYMREQYRTVMARSKFVLCPRGVGTATFRLFETLACGRVPVVISDAWVEPAGMDWASCTVRVAESDVAEIPERLEAMERLWPALSAAAATTYDEWFAPEAWFHRVVEQCATIRGAGGRRVKRQRLTAGYWRAGVNHWRR